MTDHDFEKLERVIKDIISLGKLDPLPLPNMVIKLGEEVGELNEAVNFQQGWLPHKQMKERIEGEVADVINNAIAVLVKAYPFFSELIYDTLVKQLMIKSLKWKSNIDVLKIKLST